MADETKCSHCHGTGQAGSFGAIVRAKRREMGWSQAVLAEKVGAWSPSTVTHWERDTNMPRPEHYQKLVEVLGL